jgi:hypothetical protein
MPATWADRGVAWSIWPFSLACRRVKPAIKTVLVDQKGKGRSNDRYQPLPSVQIAASTRRQLTWQSATRTRLSIGASVRHLAGRLLHRAVLSGAGRSPILKNRSAAVGKVAPVLYHADLETAHIRVRGQAETHDVATTGGLLLGRADGGARRRKRSGCRHDGDGKTDLAQGGPASVACLVRSHDTLSWDAGDHRDESHRQHRPAH